MPVGGRIRKFLEDHGHPAVHVPAVGSHGRSEDAKTALAEVVGGAPLTIVPVGSPTPCPHSMAFLDGIQHHELVGYIGNLPVIEATVAAAVRERQGRSLRTIEVVRESLVLARPAALAALRSALEPARAIALPDRDPEHPVRDVELARAEIDRARMRLERLVRDRYRAKRDAWLIVDGSLAESPLWTSDARMLGVAKSHATMPFDGEDLSTYLRLPFGHRTSLFRPASRRETPVFAWGLRLWPWAGKDVLYGLVRLETPATPAAASMADEISRWVLAERAPISTPDPRWDRLLYGVHLVEEYLRVSGEP